MEPRFPPYRARRAAVRAVPGLFTIIPASFCNGLPVSSPEFQPAAGRVRMTGLEPETAGLLADTDHPSEMTGRREGSAVAARVHAIAETVFVTAWASFCIAVVSAVATAAIYLPSRYTNADIGNELRASLDSDASLRRGDFAQIWHEEWAQLNGSAGLPPLRDNAHVPHGGLSTLLATRFPLANRVRMPELEIATRLPMPRPDGAARQSLARATPAEQQYASLPPQSEQPQARPDGIFDRLFADPDRAAKAMLAANPNTVLYDIVKRVVYMPDGEKLEAHSGFGQWLDDPESMHRKNVGVTPPNVYSVSFREKPFHGVRALRMKPVGNGNMYGRDGILAHSYLLGEAGASNGCISVKDYDKFLQAYEAGKFNQIIVVRSADEPAPPQVASMQGQGT